MSKVLSDPKVVGDDKQLTVQEATEFLLSKVTQQPASSAMNVLTEKIDTNKDNIKTSVEIAIFVDAADKEDPKTGKDDSELTKEETIAATGLTQPQVDALFTAADTDKTGTLSFEEVRTVVALSERQEAQTRAATELLDINHDGKVTPEEIAVVVTSADKNNDSFISPTEFVTMLENQDLAKQEIIESLSMKALFDSNKDGNISNEEETAAFNKIDTDHNGVITQAEAIAADLPRPSTFDASGDAQITKEEFIAHVEEVENKPNALEDGVTTILDAM